MEIISTILAALMSIFAAIGGAAQNGTLDSFYVEPETEVVQQAETPAGDSAQDSKMPEVNEHIPDGVSDLVGGIFGLVDGIRDKVGK